MDFHNHCLLIVTPDELYTYGLLPIGPGSGLEKVRRGSFAGLDVLHPFTDYPIVVTTKKTGDCCLLELRGRI